MYPRNHVLTQGDAWIQKALPSRQNKLLEGQTWLVANFSETPPDSGGGIPLTA